VKTALKRKIEVKRHLPSSIHAANTSLDVTNGAVLSRLVIQGFERTGRLVRPVRLTEYRRIPCCLDYQLIGLFAEIAIDSIQRCLIVPFVLIAGVGRADRYGRCPRRTSKCSTLCRDCRSLVPRCWFLAACSCHLSSSTSAVHCKDRRAAAAAPNLPAFSAEVSDTGPEMPMTSGGRRGHKIEAAATTGRVCAAAPDLTVRRAVPSRPLLAGCRA